MPKLLSAAEHLTISATHLEIAGQHQKEAAQHILGGNFVKCFHHERIANDNIEQAALNSLAARALLVPAGG